MQKQDEDGKIKTKAEFNYSFMKYKDISVTDPNFYNIANNSKFDNALLVISLPDHPMPETNRYYKFIAQIFII